MSALRAHLRRNLAPLLALAALAAAGTALGYLAGGSQHPSPPSPASVERPYLRGSIQSVSGDRLMLQTDAGPAEFRLGADVTVESLRPASIDRLAVGDWLNGGAVDHAQTLFALVGIVVIPASQLETAP